MYHRWSFFRLPDTLMRKLSAKFISDVIDKDLHEQGSHQNCRHRFKRRCKTAQYISVIWLKILEEILNFLQKCNAVALFQFLTPSASFTLHLCICKQHWRAHGGEQKRCVILLYFSSSQFKQTGTHAAHITACDDLSFITQSDKPGVFVKKTLDHEALTVTSPLISD